MQFGSRPAELQVKIRFSLQDNREYILDNPNMIRGVCGPGISVHIYKMLTYICSCRWVLVGSCISNNI